MEETIEKIRTAVKNGDYRIEHEGECTCNFKWDATTDRLKCDENYGDCWHSNVLYVEDKTVAEYVLEDGYISAIDGYDFEDIFPDEDYVDMFEKMEEVDENIYHNASKRDSLINYLLNCKYVLEKETDSDNVCTMILREPKAGEEANTTPEATEEWTNDFLCADNIDFRFSRNLFTFDF